MSSTDRGAYAAEYESGFRRRAESVRAKQTEAISAERLGLASVLRRQKLPILMMLLRRTLAVILRRLQTLPVAATSKKLLLLSRVT